MKKEQLLLVVAAVIFGLVVWSHSGLYASVGSMSSSGKPKAAKSAHRYDPGAGMADARTPSTTK